VVIIPIAAKKQDKKGFLIVMNMFTVGKTTIVLCMLIAPVMSAVLEGTLEKKDVKEQLSPMSYPINSTQFFSGKRGDIWAGGSFSYSSIGYASIDNNNSRIRMLALAPQARFFPCKSFCIGPRIAWAGYFKNDNRASFFNLGAEFGYLYGGEKVLPYVVGSPNWLTISEHYDNESYKDVGISIPVVAGMMIPFGNAGIGMQVEFGLNFAYVSGDMINKISVGIGVCGIGRNNAVSVLNISDLFDRIW
jgi:hypothetical protein